MNQADPQLDASVESVLNAAWPMPIWLTIVIVVGLLVFVGTLYAFERGSAGRRFRLTLTLLRFSLLAIVIWMLAGWSWSRYKSDQPELVIVVDRSASMDTRDEPDTSKRDRTRLDFARSLFENLDARDRRLLTDSYQLRLYTVADSVQSLAADFQSLPQALREIAADGGQSRLGDTLSRLIDRQAGRGTAAIVFISDGISTSGVALSEAAIKARKAAVPIHTVVVGQSHAQPDIRLVDLLVDREVYLGDQVTAQVSVVASDISATSTELSLIDASNNRVLDTVKVELSPSRNQEQVRLSFVPDRSGEIPLQLSIKPIEGEFDDSNNSLRTSVVVQDKSIKVLLVFQTASYEFRFLKSLLERTQQEGEKKTASFELTSVLQDADAMYVEQDATARRLVPSNPDLLAEYDVFILGDFDPSLVGRSAQQAILDAVTNSGSGCIFVYENSTAAFELRNWPIGKLLPVSAAMASTGVASSSQGPYNWQPTSLGSTALPMQLAGSPRGSLEIWRALPPVDLVAQVSEVNPGAQVLANAVDPQTNAALPLLVTQFAGAGRIAFQGTDETYRWTSFEGSDLYHQRYWGQMLRWLSRGKLDRGGGESTLLVEPKQGRLGQPVRFKLRLGGDSSRTQALESAEIMIEGVDSSQRLLTLPRSSAEAPVYQSTLSDLAPGSYRAMLLRPAESAPPDAEFVVAAPPGEQANLRADQTAMKFLADQSRGRFYNNRTAGKLFENLPPGKPTRLGTLPPVPFWNSHWIALLFVTLISCEWLMRRRARML